MSIEIEIDCGFPPGLEDIEPSIDIQIEKEDLQDEYDANIGPSEQQCPKNLPSIKRQTCPPFQVCEQNYNEISQYNIDDNCIRQVGKQLLTKCKQLQDKTISKNMVQVVQQFISQRVLSKFNQAHVEIFGGAANGLSGVGGDIDCTVVLDKNLKEIEQICLQEYVRASDFESQMHIQIADYAHVLEQYKVCEGQVQVALSKGEIAIIDEQLIARRDKWRKAIILYSISRAFDSHDICDYVFRARIPVLKLSIRFDTRTMKVLEYQQYMQMFAANKNKIPDNVIFMSVDLCLNNMLPVMNTKLIAEYIKASPYVQPLILIIKDWASTREITQKADPNLLNSYAISLLCINYLQMIGDVTCLQHTSKLTIVSGYNCQFNSAIGSPLQISAEGLSRRLLGFFYFYGYQFKFDSSVISIRMGRSLNRAEKFWFAQRGDFSQQFKVQADCVLGYAPDCQTEEHIARSMLIEFQNNVGEVQQIIPNLINKELQICIEDPFEINVNVARTVDFNAARLIRREFRRGFSVLKRRNALDWLLFPPQVDPPGTVPKTSFKEMKSRQHEVQKPAEFTLKIEKPAKFAFSLTK